MKFTPGCSCCGPCARICVTVGGCPDGANKFGVPGAVVTISKGAYSDSCTVDTIITSVTVTTAGSGYTSAPSVTISGGGGSGATATATLATTGVNTLTLDNGGSGYTFQPTVSFSGGGGTGATATCTVGPTSVASLTLVNGGSGYTSNPTVAITFGGGTGATATATRTGTVVTGITLTSGGSGYTTRPGVTISGGGGSGATATALLTPSAVASITKTASGSGYSSPPTISFTGATGGTGAAATATLSARGVGSVTVTAPGSGYTSIPTVSFSGGGGTNAAASAKPTSSCCIDVTAGAGTYDISVSASRFITLASTQVVSTCTGATFNKTMNLTVDSNYTCCLSYLKPVPKNLTITTAIGTLTASLNAPCFWLGSITKSETVAKGPDDINGYPRCIATGTGTMTITYWFRMDLGLSFGLSQLWCVRSCCDDSMNSAMYVADVDTPSGNACASAFLGESRATSTIDFSAPMNFTFTIPSGTFTGCPGNTTIPDPVGGSIVVSE